MAAGASGESAGSWTLCALGTTLVVGLSTWLSWETSLAVHALPERAPFSPKPQSLAKEPRTQIVTKDRNLVPLLALQHAVRESGRRSADLDAVRSKVAELQDDPAPTAQAVGRMLDRLCTLGLVKRSRQGRYSLTDEGRSWIETARREGRLPDADRE